MRIGELLQRVMGYALRLTDLSVGAASPLRFFPRAGMPVTVPVPVKGDITPVPSLQRIDDFRFDIQRFAAEDEGRTEEPTEKKIRDARDKGQVAKTQELPQAIVVIFGFLVIFILGAWIYTNIAKMTNYYLTSFSRFSFTERSTLLEFFRVLDISARILLPVFAVAIVGAILGNVVQVGFKISTHPLKPDFSKIKFDPSTMFKRVFFSKQIGMNLFKSIFKVVAIGFIAYLIILGDYETILKTPDISVSLALQQVGITALKIIIWSMVLLLVLSIPDYIFQKREFMESLKMTKEELKEELKETVGDPYIRARLREMQREIAMRSMIKEVPRADVVVTNPTHYAVALRYDRGSMDAPTVTSKGVDSMALKIRQIAVENGVFMVENRPLARELYNTVEIGDMIPEELFRAVSYVYAELYKKRGYREAI